MKDVQKTQVARRKKRKKKIKLHARFYYIIVTVIVIVSGFVLSRTIFFNMTELKAEGPYSAEQLMQTCGLKMGKNLFSIDLEECERLISDNLVKAESVKVSRSLPATLKVTVTEAVPYMNIKADDGTYYLVSESMRVLSAKSPEPQADIITVDGCSPAETEPCKTLTCPDETKLSLVSEIMEHVYKSDLKNAKTVDVSNRASIVIRYTDTLKIELGDDTNIDYKLTLAKTIIDRRGSPSEAGTVNVSSTEYPSFYADRDTSSSVPELPTEDTEEDSE